MCVGDGFGGATEVRENSFHRFGRLRRSERNSGPQIWGTPEVPEKHFFTDLGDYGGPSETFFQDLGDYGGP